MAWYHASMERNEISIQEARVYLTLKNAATWLTNPEIAKLAAPISPRTVRATTLKFVRLQLVDQAEVLRRVFEAADIEDAEKLFAAPQQPDPQQQALALAGAQAEIAKTTSETAKNNTTAQKTQVDALAAAANLGFMMGTNDDPLAGGIPGMAGGPGDGMGYGGDGLLRREAA